MGTYISRVCKYVHPIALFEMEDDKGREEKILCVPKSDPLWYYI
jgi:inorganic pyrophosphatase